MILKSDLYWREGGGEKKRYFPADTSCQCRGFLGEGVLVQLYLSLERRRGEGGIQGKGKASERMSQMLWAWELSQSGKTSLWSFCSPKTIPNPPQKNMGWSRPGFPLMRYRGGTGVQSSRSRGAGGRAQCLGALPGPSRAGGCGGCRASPEHPLTQVPAFCGARSRPRGWLVHGDAALTPKGELRYCSAWQRCEPGLPDPPKAAQQPGGSAGTQRGETRGRS